jgi:hypothetical protein
VAAGLTAVTVTVASSYAGSYLGPSGTLICTVLAAMLSTAATAVYAHWIRLSGRGLAHLHKRRLRVSPLVLAAAVIGLLVVVIGGITGIEAVTGKPLSALTGGDHVTGTTLGRVFAPPPATTPPATVTPTPSPSPTMSPSASPSPSPSASESFPIFSPTPAASFTPGPPPLTPTDTAPPAGSASPVPS